MGKFFEFKYVFTISKAGTIGPILTIEIMVTLLTMGTMELLGTI